jgi:hypothetical protein
MELLLKLEMPQRVLSQLYWRVKLYPMGLLMVAKFSLLFPKMAVIEFNGIYSSFAILNSATWLRLIGSVSPSLAV